MSVAFLVADVLHSPPELAGPFDFVFDPGCYHVVRRENVTAYLETLCMLTRPGTLGLVLPATPRSRTSRGRPS